MTPLVRRGKRFPLPNTYRTVLAEFCALQDPMGRDSLGIMAQVLLQPKTALAVQKEDTSSALTLPPHARAHRMQRPEARLFCAAAAIAQSITGAGVALQACTAALYRAMCVPDD